MSSNYDTLRSNLKEKGIDLPSITDTRKSWRIVQDRISTLQQEIQDCDDEKEKKKLKSYILASSKEFLDIYHLKIDEIYPHLYFEVGEDNSYWLYNEELGIYDELNKLSVQSTIMKLLMDDGITPTIAWSRECLMRYRAEFQYKGKHFSDFDTDKNFLHVKNGWLDLTTYTLTDHTPERLSRFKSPIVYDPEATCPLYDSLLDEVFPIKKDAIRVIDQFSGYLLTGDTHLGKMLVIISRPGFGKSTLIDAWVNVLGTNQLVIKRSLSSLEGSRFSAASFVGKNLCWFDESKTKHSDMGIKLEQLITGSDITEIERKGIQGIVEAKSNIKCVLTANNLPQHKEDGIFRRMIYIEFPANVPTLTDAMKADPRMNEKLRAEASGILNRMLRGLKDLQKMGNFTVIEGHDEQIEEMKIANETITEFIYTYFDPDPSCNEFYPTKDLFQAYSHSDFFIGKRYIQSVQQFAYMLRTQVPTQYFPTLQKKRMNTQKGWTGIKVKEEYKFSDGGFGSMILQEKESLF